MDEREREVIREEPVVEHNRTTVINTGGDGGRGGGGVIAAVLLLVVLAVVAFFVFGQGLGGSDGDTEIKVDIETPDLPDVDLPAPGNQTK